MITILFYIIIAIIAIALLSVLLPYIILGVIVYLIYRNWESVIEILSAIIGIGWKILTNLIELIYNNWQITICIFIGLLILGFIVNLIQQYKCEKLLKYINKVGICEAKDLFGKIEMIDSEIVDSLNFLVNTNQIEKIDLKETTLYKTLKSSGENYIRVELAID